MSSFMDCILCYDVKATNLTHVCIYKVKSTLRTLDKIN